MLNVDCWRPTPEGSNVESLQSRRERRTCPDRAFLTPEGSHNLAAGRRPGDRSPTPTTLKGSQIHMYNARMEPLARWIRREYEGPLIWPSVSVFLGVLAAALVFIGSLGLPSAEGVVVCILSVLLGCVPALLHVRRNRHRPKLNMLCVAANRGQLGQAIGPRAEQLNEGALDLEQIISSLRQDSADVLDRKGLMAQAKERFRRAFDLSLGAAAGYSLTREGADRQIEADLEWLRQARQHSEMLLLGSGHSEESLEHLHELKALVTAREDAIEELGLRG